MTWNVEFLPEADKDLDDLSQSNQLIVKKQSEKFSKIHYRVPCRKTQSISLWSSTGSKKLPDFTQAVPNQSNLFPHLIIQQKQIRKLLF